MRKPQSKLKEKRVSLDAGIFLNRVDSEIKSEERDPFFPVNSFTTFPE